MSTINYIKKLDKQSILKLIDEGYIRESVHPSGELFIYNYTDKAVYDKVWIDETLQCRGLITDKEGNIMASIKDLIGKTIVRIDSMEWFWVVHTQNKELFVINCIVEDNVISIESDSEINCFENRYREWLSRPTTKIIT